MTAARTPWYPWHVTPVRVGIYERHIEGDVVYSYWNGISWFGYSIDRQWALENYKRGAVSSYQRSRWRGKAKR